MADFFDLSNTQQNNNDDFFKLDKKETNQPQPEQFSKLMPGNYNTEDEIVENTLKGLASGTMRDVIGGIGAAPSYAARTLYKLAAYPQNKLAELTGNEDLKVDYDEDFLGKFKALKPIDDVFIRGGEAAANIADNLSPLQNFDKDMLTNFKEGNYRDLGAQLFYNAVETAPQIAMLAYTSGLSNTMSGAAKTSNMLGNNIVKANLVKEMPSLMIGASGAGSGYIENRQNPNMTEGERLLNATAYGAADAAWERVWTLPMIRKIAADELIEKPVKEGFIGAAVDYGTKALKGGGGEAFEEVGTEVTNILTDLATGKDVGDPLNRIFTSGAGALLPGGVMGGASNINQRNYNLQVQKGAKMAWDTIFNNPQEVEIKKFNFVDDTYRPVTKPEQLTTTEIAGLLETKGESPIILESGEALGPPVIELWPESQTYLDTGTGEVFVSGGEEITLPKVNRFVDPSGQYVGNSEIDITTVARQRKQQEDVAQTPIEQPNNVDMPIENENQTDEGLNTQETVEQPVEQQIVVENETAQNFINQAQQQPVGDIDEGIEPFIIQTASSAYRVLTPEGNVKNFNDFFDALEQAADTRNYYEENRVNIQQPIQEGQQQQEGVVEDEGQQEYELNKYEKYFLDKKYQDEGFSKKEIEFWREKESFNALIRAANKVANKFGEKAGYEYLEKRAFSEPTKKVKAEDIDTSDIPIEISPNDLDNELLIRAFRGTSHTPKDRADLLKRSYINHIKDLYNELNEIVGNETQRKVLTDELQKYKENYIKKLNDYLSSQSRVSSPMIAGPANFNTRQNDKRAKAAQNKRKAMVEWQEKAKKSIRRKIKKQEGEVVGEQPQINIQAEGKESETATPNNTEVKTKFAVMNADDIQASHDTSLNVNENFPQELQPRDRGKAATQEQIINIVNNLNPKKLGDSYSTATGSPILGPDGYVEVGNGRTIALKTLYEQNHKNAETYRQWLRDNAEQFGLTAKQIDNVDNPVLVRVRTSDVEDRVRFVQDANARESASMSASEQAMVDADRITQDLLNKFVPNDDGLINIAANKPFINQFMDQVVGKAEKGEFLDEKGYLNQAGIRKVKNALFAAAYDDINILAEISESTSSNLKNVTGAMMEAAPRMVNIQDQMNKGILPDLDISQDLVEAVKLYKTIKNSDKSFDNYFQQQNMFGEDNYTPIQESLVRMFENNKRSRKALREILIDYTYRVEHAGRADMDSMFDVEQPTKENLLRQSVEATVGKTNTSQETLFGKEPKNININGKNVKMSNNATEFSQKNKYARAKFTLNDKKIEMPELLDIILALSEGKYPQIIKSLRNTGTLGYYAPKEGQIGLNPDIFVGETIVRERVPVKQFDRRFQEIQTTIANDPDIGEVEYRTSFSKNYVEIRVIRVDPEYAAQTISHELGHLIDFIPRDDFDDGGLMDQMSIIYKGQKDEVLDAIRDSNNLGPRIKTELKRLSMKWKPFDPKNNLKFTKYRFSPEELYADAMSVFFLDLDMLQQEAPLFSQFIQKSISKKPAVKKSYNTVRHLMENRSEMINKTFDNLQEGMVDGVEQTKKKIQRRERGVKSGFDWLIESFIDKNSALYKYFRGEYSDTGEKGKLSREARNKMEEIAYMSSEVEDYLYNIGQIVEGLSNYDIDFLDFNSFLFNKRVLGDRRTYANPLFVNTVRAEEMQQALLDKYGEEKYQQIVNAAEKYYQLRQERIIPIMEKSNMFTEAAMEKVKNNKEYVTFEVVDYINTEFGEGTGDIIMRQYGTGRKISNPLVATMLKDMSIISSIRINESKVAAVKALKKIAPESIRQAPTKEIYGKIIPKDSTDADEGLITFTVNGKLDGYLVEKDIADLYEYTPHKANAATNTFLSIVQGMKSIMVSHNPGWMIFNIPRDFFATVMNNPEIGIKDIPALAHEYKKAFSEAWNNVRHNKRSEDISYMRRNRMLTIDRMYRPSDSYMEDDTQQLLTEIFDYNEQSGEEHSRLQKLIPDKVRSAWEGLDNFGQVSEMTGQIAGYRMLKNMTNLSEGDLAHRVRTRVGTPDFKQRGALHSITNNLFIFSTIRKSGWTAAAESFRQNPGTFLFKVALLSLLPKLLQLGAEEVDELFPNSEFAKKIAETMEGVSEYKKETYLVVPVWKANGKAITIQLPQDFIGQAVTSLVYNAARGEWGDVAGTAWTELPWNTSNLNPLLQAAADVQRLTSGENIYDTWRGRNVISEEAMLTGNVGQKLKEFGLYEFFNLGGSAIVNPSIAYADGTLEALSNIIPFNAAKRLINVSESGYYEDVTQVYQDQKKYTQMVSNFNNSRRYGEKLRYDMKEIGEAKRKLSQLNKLIRHFANINKQIKYAQSQGNTELVDKLNMRKINLARQYTGKKPLDN